jgi:hypothetical protein
MAYMFETRYIDALPPTASDAPIEFKMEESRPLAEMKTVGEI